MTIIVLHTFQSFRNEAQSPDAIKYLTFDPIFLMEGTLCHKHTKKKRKYLQMN